MELTHFLALIPMIVFLCMSLVFWGKGLVHILTFGYATALALMAIINSWEILFYVPIFLAGIISVILFIIAMTRGNWL